MNYFSLFSGIGGFELGFPKEWKCVGYSETDKWATAIYKYHFREHKNYGDAIRIIPKNLPDFDLLVAGFPCQSFSIAGKRKGFQDTRGTLFFEIARICRDKRPRYILLENVKGLLSHEDGKTFQSILGILTDIGYLLQWEVLNSKNFGVPQNRERVFIVGYLGKTGRPEIFPLGESYKTNDEIQQNEREKKARASCLSIRYGQRWTDETYIISRPHGFNEGGKREYPNVRNSTIQNELLYIGGIVSDRKKWLKGKDNLSREFSQGQRVYNSDGIAQTLAGNAGGQGGKTGLYMLTDENIRRLIPTECERLQGFPDNFTKYGIDEKENLIKISDVQQYKCLGNAVTVNVIREIAKKFNNGD